MIPVDGLVRVWAGDLLIAETRSAVVTALPEANGEILLLDGDVRPEALGNRCSLHLGLLGNVKDTLDAVLPSIREKADSSHLSEALSDCKRTRRDLDALAESIGFDAGFSLYQNTRLSG